MKRPDFASIAISAAIAAVFAIGQQAVAFAHTPVPTAKTSELFAAFDHGTVASGDSATIAWFSPNAESVSIDCAGAVPAAKTDLQPTGTETIAFPKSKHQSIASQTCEVTAHFADGTFSVERMSLTVADPVPTCNGSISRGPKTASGAYGVSVRVPGAFQAFCQAPRAQDWKSTPFVWPAHDSIADAETQSNGTWLPRSIMGIVDASADGAVTDFAPQGASSVLPLIPATKGSTDTRTYARCYIQDSLGNMCKIEKYGI